MSTYTTPLPNGGGHLELRREPGDRPQELYTIAQWRGHGMQAGALTGDEREMLAVFAAVERLSRMVERDGFPAEAA
jgi:hypothetical protein